MLGPYILDFYCAEARLVIELDGTVHESDEAKGYDAARDQWLEAYGYRIVRFHNEDVFHDLEAALIRIVQTAMQHSP